MERIRHAYVKNKDLLEEIRKYKEDLRNGKDKMSENLGVMIMLIANGLAQKPNFSGYTWIEDMKAEAVFTVVKYLRNFDPEKSQNAFAYVTTICMRAFIAYLNKQKKHSKIKNDLFEFQNTEFGDIQNKMTKEDKGELD